MMLERLLYKAITDGITMMQENPQLIVDFFCEEALLEVSEAEKIRDFFLEKPPSVVHGYARKDSDFPLYAITLTSQGQGQGFIGDEGMFHSDPDDPDYGTEDWAAIFEYSYNIIVYTNHPDTTLYYFHLLVNFLIGAEVLFKVKGDAFDISFGGADMIPDTTTMPAGLFLRRCSVSMKRQYTQTVVGSKLNRAWKLQGLHIEPSGAVGEDNGGVAANVRFFGGDDDEEE